MIGILFYMCIKDKQSQLK